MQDGAGPLLWYPGHELLLENIVRAENCHLFDDQGRRYVDLESGVWCMSLGHGHPSVLEAMSSQAARLAHTGFGFTNEVAETAAREILTLLGLDCGRCVFLCSGSEAVEFGVRLARTVAPRPRFMTMADSYFGAYGSARRQADDEWFCFDWQPCAACPHADDCSEKCEHWAAIPFGDLGGFLFEPGSSSGLVRFPPEKLIRNLVAEMRRNRGLVLINEVTTGVGRTGRWFGYQHYDFTPDIVAMGKGIGNGYPVSVTAVAPSVMENLGDRPLNYAQSHQNDPCGAAVVRAVVGAIRDGSLVERSHTIGDRLRVGLEDIRSRTTGIREIRARGLMMAVELEDDPETGRTIRAHRELVKRGYVVGRRPGVPVLRLDPSLTVELEDIEGFLEAFAAVMTPNT